MSPRPQTSVRLTLSGINRGMGRLGLLSLFIVPFGMAYGIAAIEHGLTAMQAVGSSILVFSGAAQFAILDLWADDMSFLAVFMVTVAVSARHILMGAALSPWVNNLDGKRCLLAAVYLTDPNFADTHQALKRGEQDIGILVGGGLICWFAWVLGTGIGAFAGSQLGDPKTFGIDVLMPVYFAALVMPSFVADRKWSFIAVAAGVAIFTQPLLPTGWNIVLAAISGGGVGVLTRD